jgi:hypothetical protein
LPDHSIEEGVGIDWIKPFSLPLDPKVMDQVNNLHENDRRRDFPPPEKFKSHDAGIQGRFSSQVIDELVLDFVSRMAKSVKNPLLPGKWEYDENGEVPDGMADDV